MVFKNVILSLVVAMSVVLVSSCKKDDPSVLKVFVRSSANILTPDAKVRIVADVDLETPEYMDEMRTNESGVAVFDLGPLFEEYGKKDDKVAYFTIYAKDTSEFYTIKKTRAKMHLTSTETIIIED